MSKEDRQIVWIKHIARNSGRSYFYGYYEGKKLFFISEERCLFLVIFSDMFVKPYETISGAKRGAARFLRRFQEAVK